MKSRPLGSSAFKAQIFLPPELLPHEEAWHLTSDIPRRGLQGYNWLGLSQCLLLQECLLVTCMCLPCQDGKSFLVQGTGKAPEFSTQLYNLLLICSVTLLPLD